MTIRYVTFGAWMIFCAGLLFAQGPEREERNLQQRRPPHVQGNREEEMIEESQDIVLDYRGLIHKIDDMRRHEEDVLRQLEDLARSYEAGLKKLEDTEKALEDEMKEIREWHEKAIAEMKTIAGASEPREIKNEVRDVPSDRYTSGYPD